MKSMRLIMLAIVLVGSGAFAAGYYASGVEGIWNNTATWGGSGYPIAGDTAYINLGSTVTVDGTDESVWQLHHASWSGNPDLVTLNIVNGGSLSVSDWAYLGVAVGDFAEVNVSAGSTFTCAGPLNVGYNGNCVLNIDGGTINATNGGFFVSNPWAAGTGSGTVHLNSGTINVGSQSTYTDFAMSPAGLIDIYSGKIKIYGLWWDGMLDTYIGDGRIIGWGGIGTVSVSHDGDYTLVTGIHPYQPNPANGEVVSAGPYTMTWVLPDPNAVGGTVTCDVYLAAGDPNFLPSTKIVSDQAVELADVTLENGTNYYWRIDIHDTTEPNIIVGPVFNFYAGNQAPVVNAGGDVYTWLEGGTAEVNLSGTVVEDDEIPVPATVAWELTSEPAAGSITFTTPTYQLDIAVSLSALGDYVLTLTADDTEFTGSDSVTIHVYSDSCQAAKAMGIPLLQGDFNEDCIVDLADFSVLADNWLDSIAL